MKNIGKVDPRLARVIFQFPEAVLVEDEHRKVLLANQRFCDFFGYQMHPDELIGMDCSNAAEESKMFFSDPEGFVKRIEEILQVKEIVIGDELALADGRYLLRDYIPVTIDGSYKGHAWKYRDITELKQTSNELERLNQLNNRLFSIISHDLRGPLTSLGSILSMIKEGDFSEEEIKEIIPELSKDVDHTSRLVENLLSWSAAKIENDQADHEELNLSALVKQSIQLLEKTAAAKEVKLVNSVPESIKVNGDKGMIDVVIRNILTNAIKFSNAGDKVLINAEPVDDKIRVTIKDEGIGVKEEKIDQLFDHQIGTTIGTAGEKGIGLGLLICKDFIHANGGVIGARSNEGRGSTFYFTIPAA